MLLQLGEQSFSLLEIPRSEAFIKTTIDGRKDVERFGVLASIHPQPRQIGCRAKLKPSRLLAAGR